MSRYLKDNSTAVKIDIENKGKYVSTHRVDRAKEAIVKNSVTVPMYFYRIIVPQLGDYYSDYPVDFDAKPVACCPLHDEDTPSFRYYEATSSFYCFGCQKGGDIIQLHRYFVEKTSGRMPDRSESIEFLFEYFINENELASFTGESGKAVSTLDKITEVNDEKQIVKLNIYRFNLEKAITFDRNINQETKEKLWDILDKVDLFIDKGLVKAEYAEEYIKNNVKKLVDFNASEKKFKKLDYKGVNSVPFYKSVSNNT